MSSLAYLLHGLIGFVGNHQLVFNIGLAALDVPGDVVTHFIFDDVFQVFGEVSSMIHARVELVNPILRSQITFISKALPL